MEIREQKGGIATVVGLRGRLDASTSPDVENGLMGLIQQGEKRIVLDLSDLAYISSVGLRVLVFIAKNVQQTKGKLAIAAPGNHIQEIFRIAGFTSIFSIYPTCDEALAHLRSDAISPDGAVATPGN